ncbi:hypothetical protein M3Y94_01078100 [Aphelenchoides besseyi]|nr:hypothetical protein M3Y94_01078100 [Aphelenchoides besseyi]
MISMSTSLAMQLILLAFLLLNLCVDGATTSQKPESSVRRFFHSIPFWIWIIVGIVMVTILMTIAVACILCKSKRDSENEFELGKIRAKRKKRAASLLLPSQQEQQPSSELGAGGKTSGTKEPQYSETLVPAKKSATKKRVIDWESASPQASDRLEMWNNLSSQ